MLFNTAETCDAFMGDLHAALRSAQAAANTSSKTNKECDQLFKQWHQFCREVGVSESLGEAGDQELKISYLLVFGMMHQVPKPRPYVSATLSELALWSRPSWQWARGSPTWVESIPASKFMDLRSTIPFKLVKRTTRSYRPQSSPLYGVQSRRFCERTCTLTSTVMMTGTVLLLVLVLVQY